MLFKLFTKPAATGKMIVEASNRRRSSSDIVLDLQVVTAKRGQECDEAKEVFKHQCKPVFDESLA